jgi:hypothetical protein
VSNIPKGLIDSFGLQGFPWEVADDAANYLPAQSAMACATRLGVKDIWLNTGSFARRKADNGADITADANTRLAHLGGELAQALAINQQGFNVNVNLYAKNDYPDGPDWSYTTADDYTLIRQGIAAATTNRTSVSFFDA